jgi:hypothetical protein
MFNPLLFPQPSTNSEEEIPQRTIIELDEFPVDGNELLQRMLYYWSHTAWLFIERPH